jgi:polygalacturonase
VLFSGVKLRVATFLWSLLAVGNVCWAGTPPLPVISNQVFIVTNTAFAGGAYGNGVSNSAAAINAAISYASSHGGGTVQIPAVAGGLTNYISGPITMASQVNLQIDSNAVLRMFPMSTWVSNYGSSTPFINASSLHDISITGSGTIPASRGASLGAGTIDGQGTNWWYPLASSRPNFLNIGGCTRVLIENVKLQNPPTFTIYMKSSDANVTINHITIDTPFDSHNTDGFDITSTNVLIQNSYISAGDDNVEIGGTSAAATDITISNCTFGTGHGVSMGSYTGGGVNNLIVSNCSWVGTEYGIKLKTDRDRGGLIQNLKYCDLVMTNVNFPFAFYDYYNSMGSPSKTITNAPAGVAADASQPITSTTPIVRNITISNLTAVGNSGIQGPGNIAGIIFGLPESPITNMALMKVSITGRSTDGTICLYNVRDIRMIDCNLTAPLTGTNVLTLYNAQFTITNSTANTNSITFTGLGSPSNSVLSLFNGQASTTAPAVLGANPLLTLASSKLTASNNMNFGGTSVLNFGLGTNLTQTAVTGNLTLGGTLNIVDAGGFTNTTYALFTYGGTLTYVGLTIGAKPDTNFTYTVSTNTVGQVNLVVSGAVTPPLASFGGSPTNGTEPLLVTFTDTSTGNITNRYWDFGDSTTTNVTTNVVSHTYAAGTYTVMLAVDGPGGVSTNTRIAYITALTAFQAWQVQYFGCTACPQADGNADPDGDGVSNTNEFLTGTNPTNSASAFQILLIARSTNDVVITWQTAGGHTNAVQATAGNSSGSYTANFTDLSSPMVIVGPGDQTTNYTDAGGATNNPARYYRIRLAP